MWNKDDILTECGLSLTMQELVDYEHSLKSMVAEFLAFKSYSLFFPRKSKRRSEPVAEFRRETGELLLPLIFRGESLGYFVAKGVKLTAPVSSLKYLTQLVSAALEKIALYKRTITEPLSELRTYIYLQEKTEQAVVQVQNSLVQTDSSPLSSSKVEPSFSGTFGVLYLDLDHFLKVNEEHGFLVGDLLIKKVGQLIKKVCPKHVVAARLSHDKFGILIPNAHPRSCFQLAEVLRAALSKLPFSDKVTGDTLQLSASIGYATYPHSMHGPEFRKESGEQAQILFAKAQYAVNTAKDNGRNSVLGYSDILQIGGKILQCLPDGRMLISLGNAVGAMVGQRFLVRGPRKSETSVPTLPYKGEVVLVEVHKEYAFAEILNLVDATISMHEEDRLKLVDDTLAFDLDMENDVQNPHAELRSYREFIAFLTKARKNSTNFGLTLIRVESLALESSANEEDGPTDKLTDKSTGEQAVEQVESEESYQAKMNEMLQLVHKTAHSLAPNIEAGGVFGLGGLIYFQNDVTASSLLEQATALEKQVAQEYDIHISIGAAYYPYLTFDRADIFGNCRKALEHAILLDRPQVAVFDSVSLNLSADRRFMGGDIYGAVEEFKLALLADDGNLLARNSLGVCYAQTGQFEDARREFEKVVLLQSDDVFAFYNLGWANQQLSNFDKAEKAYQQCLAIDSDHIYALTRLGSLAERAKDFVLAEKYYMQAVDLPEGKSIVYRPLARVVLAQKTAQSMERAREFLHLALQVNHNDHRALHMLAKLYLKLDEDLQIIEVLARQAAALAPNNNEYWETLEYTLDAQGLTDEAQQVANRQR